MSNKAVTQMTDPEYTVEFDGKETYVMRNGVKLAMRREFNFRCCAIRSKATRVIVTISSSRRKVRPI
jgi:hypothetical protein